MKIKVSHRPALHVAAGALLACAAVASGADGQVPENAASAPEAVVRAALDALAAQRWAQVAALVHPEGLRQFRQEQLRFVMQMQDRRAREPVRDSTVPPAVAEYLTKRLNEAMGPSDPASLGFARVKSLEELQALDPREFFARWLEGHHSRPDNYAGGVAPTWIRTVIGSVAENDAMAHVVYRVQVDLGGRLAPAEIEVVTVRRVAGTWRLVLNDDLAFQGMIGSVTLSDPN